MSSSSPFRLRILVGAGSFTDATAALRIIEQLPSEFCMGLGGVLVEEVDMLTVCDIPDQRVVSMSGKTTLAPNRAQVRTLLKADARAFQQSLAQTATICGTSWTFANDKGELVAAALRAAANWDVLVLGYRRIHKGQGKVVLLKTSSQFNDELDAAAHQLARHFSTDTIAFSITEHAKDGAHHIAANTVQFGTLNESLSVLRRTNAHVVLLDLRRGPVRTQTELSRLLEAARCPVIVFGASQANPALEHSTQIPPHPADSAH